jgi:hypothetical protein
MKKGRGFYNTPALLAFVGLVVLSLGLITLNLLNTKPSPFSDLREESKRLSAKRLSASVSAKRLSASVYQRWSVLTSWSTALSMA